MPPVFAASILVLPFAFGLGASAQAQTADGRTAPSHKTKPNPYGSPLDTMMSTRLWTDVPPAQDFVKETRPDAKQLDYAPLTGTDPARPKPRDKPNIQALQAELEHDGAQNESKARGLRGPAKGAPAAHRARAKGAK